MEFIGTAATAPKGNQDVQNTNWACLSYLSAISVVKHFGCASNNLPTCDKKLYIPTGRTECYKKNFPVTGAETWNTFPDSMKELPSLSIFKRKIRDDTFCFDNT